MKINKKKDFIIFIIISIISYIIFQGYITNHYATDTYNIMNKGYTEYSMSNSFIDGRIIMGGLNLIVDFINLPTNIVVISFTLIGILISCIAVIILKNMILDIKQTQSKFLEIIAITISYVTIFNFMYVENLYFIEAIVMGLSILMYTLAIREIVQKNKHYYLKALIYSIIATFSYQGTIGLLMIYGFLFIITKNKKDTKQIMKDLLIVISIIGVSYIINIIQIKIITNILDVNQKRLNGISELISDAKNVFLNFDYKIFYVIILNSCGLFPSGLMLYLIIAIIGIVMIYEIKNKKETLFKGIIQILILSILITTGMCIISSSSYDTGRIHNVIGALIGLIYIYIFCNSDIFIRNNNIKIILTIILVIYTVILMLNTMNLINQHKKVNNLEKQQCEQLEQYIKKYEQENNTKVTKAKYFQIGGKKERGYFETISNKSVLTYNGVACIWSSIGTINFYTNRNFKDEEIIMEENMEENMKLFINYVKNIQNGLDNNFVIVNDTLYYSVFI